ncbi:MAG: hypothetical protein Roseis2KO_47520 [Roseivirga sp.]
MIIEHYSPVFENNFINLYKEIWKDDPYGELFSEKEVKQSLRQQHLLILALGDERELMGFIGGFPFEDYQKKEELKSVDIGGKVFYFSELAVKKTYRKMGIAQKLYEAFEEAVHDKGYNSILLRTSASALNPALNFYNDAGYQHIPGIESKVSQTRIDERPIIDTRFYYVKTLTKSEIRIKGHKNYDQILERFKRENNIKIIVGISGGSDSILSGVDSDDDLQIKYREFKGRYDEHIITGFLKILSGYKVAILTGGTKWGIPKLANKVAKELGFKTIGVYPRAGKKHAIEGDLLDLRICVGSMIGQPYWGDEGPVWTSLIDSVLVIGGGAGTLTEFSHLQKINESRIKYGKRPKYIVPISGSGGVAEQLSYIPIREEVKSKSMPPNRIHNGVQAGRYLLDKLSLSDYFEY